MCDGPFCSSLASWLVRPGGWVLVCFLLPLGACHHRDAAVPEGAPPGDGVTEGEVEDLTIVVKADKSRIQQEENALRLRKADFDAERQRLERERSEIAEKLSTLSKKDKTQREKLEQAEYDLTSRQQRLSEKADNFESERSKLEEDKSRLLARIGEVMQTKGGLTIEQREQAIAQREQGLAQREQTVALREKDVTRRESEAASGLHEVQKVVGELHDEITQIKTSRLSAPSPASSMGNSGSRSTALRLQHQMRQKMETRGILPDDLPSTLRSLETSGASAMGNKDFAAAQDVWAQLNQAVDGITVDHAFVQAKMARISRQFEEKKRSAWDEAQKKRVQGLLAEASDSFSDGRYDRANKKINQIFALLQSRTP